MNRSKPGCAVEITWFSCRVALSLGGGRPGATLGAGGSTRATVASVSPVVWRRMAEYGRV
jgi:hypothetical protein